MREIRDLSFLLGDDDYAARMKGEVTVWRENNLHVGTFNSFDGTQIAYYYAINPNARGTIVVLHGFSEFIGKYRELLYSFYMAGYNVFFYEQRGHGRSGRVSGVKDDFVYVRSFMEYEKDLKHFMDFKVLPVLNDVLQEDERKHHPIFLFAHSMGGAVSTLFLEDFPGYFDAAVLCSPMIEMENGGVSRTKVNMITGSAKALHVMKKPLFGQKGYDPNESFEESCTQSKVRFDYYLNLRRQYPEYRTVGITFGWIAAAVKAQDRILKNAEKVRIPIILLQAEKDTLVRPEAQAEFASLAKRTRLIVIKDAKHEIMNATPEIRKEYYETIFEFFDSISL